MDSLIPHTQQIIQVEIEQLRRKQKSANQGRTPELRRIPKSDIKQMQENFTEILTGQVVVE